MDAGLGVPPTSQSTPFLGFRWLVIGLPWVFVPWVANPFWEPKTAVFQVGCWLFIIWTLFGPTTSRATWPNPWLKWVLGWVILSVGWQFWKTLILRAPTSEMVVIFNWYTMIPTINVLTGCLVVYLLVTRYLPSLRLSFQLSQWMCYGAFAVAVYAILQYLGVDQFFRHSEYVTNIQNYGLALYVPALMVGHFGNVGETASYLAIHLPLFLMFQERRFFVFFLIVVLAIVLTGRLYALVAGGVGLMTYAFIRCWHRSPTMRQWFIGSMVIGLLAAGVMGWQYRTRLTSDTRWPVWVATVTEWRHSPWMGHGMGSFPQDFYQDAETIKAKYPAIATQDGAKFTLNEFLQGLYELGLIGMVPVVLLIINMFRRSFMASKSILKAGWVSAAVIFLTMSLLHVTWYMAPIGLVGLVVWAMNETREVVA